MRIISAVVQTKHEQRIRIGFTTNRRIHKSAAVSETTSLKLLVSTLLSGIAQAKQNLR